MMRYERQCIEPALQTHCLSGEEVDSFCLKHRGKNLHLIAGRAWVTYDTNDVIVQSGETICIPASKHCVIISPVNRFETIYYQLQ